ncbi:MAG: WYL domain-containing protein [Ginsengibacter sp.]|jgi:hypothetical protein
MNVFKKKVISLFFEPVMPTHLQQLIRIYNRLRRGPVTIEIISKWAKQAGITISERQLYRNLEKLKDISLVDGESIIEYVNEKNKKTWKLEYNEDSEKLSTYDINSFFLLKNFAPYLVLEARKSSIEKFEKIIYQKLSKNNYQQYIQANELYLRKTNYKANLFGFEEQSQVEDLIWALHNNRIIIVEQDIINIHNVHIPPESFPLQMFPMELVFHRGRINLAGLSSTNQFLVFAIDRQFIYKLTNETFNRKKLLQTYNNEFEKLYGLSIPINNKIYNIQIEFTTDYAASFKTYHWHSSQQWILLKNGNYMLHLHCSIGRELVGFITHGLCMVKVHQPKILKDLVLKKLKDTVAIYEKNLDIEDASANAGL